MFGFDFSMLDSFHEMLDRVSNADFHKHHLSARLQVVLQADNYNGVLSGTDGKGMKLIPTKYRSSLGGVAFIGKPKYAPIQYRRSSNYFLGSVKDEIPRDYQTYMYNKNLMFTGNAAKTFGGGSTIGGVSSTFFRPAPQPSDHDLYRGLVGPPTAPSWDQSRVITNYHTYDISGAGRRVAVESAWSDIRNEKGENFLPQLFYGKNGVPPRDLTGIRYWGLYNASNQAAYFFDDLEDGTIA